MATPFVAGLAVGVALTCGASAALLLVLGLVTDGAGSQRRRGEPTTVCDGCGQTFADELSAIEHVREEHRAPDARTARQILSPHASGDDNGTQRRN